MYRYHKPTPDTFRIVGVLVWPARFVVHSIHLTPSCLIMLISIGGPQDSAATCEVDPAVPLILSEDISQAIRYSYRVTWNVSERK